MTIYLTAGVLLGLIVLCCLTGRSLATGDNSPFQFAMFVALVLAATAFTAWQVYEQDWAQEWADDEWQVALYVFIYTGTAVVFFAVSLRMLFELWRRRENHQMSMPHPGNGAWGPPLGWPAGSGWGYFPPGGFGSDPMHGPPRGGELAMGPSSSNSGPRDLPDVAEPPKDDGAPADGRGGRARGRGGRRGKEAWG